MSIYMDICWKENTHMQNILDKIINNKVKTGALRILCRRNIGYTGRQLAGELGVSPTTASKFLGELVKEGAVMVSGAGRAYLYRINEKNYAVRKMLRPFFQKEKDIFDALIALIKKNLSKSSADVESAIIFGSVAKKEQDTRSDVDLLVVVKNLKGKKKMEHVMDMISGVIAQNFQIIVSPYILTADQFRKKHKEKSPLIREILDSYILILGKSPERL
ncbi:MAG: hypothetical protein COW11_03305, partial [Candidatus Omnitrophica bacterium CG12_big_fil_rev_8_21_14_0_65_43_15]